jgi:hypothetical protein
MFYATCFGLLAIIRPITSQKYTTVISVIGIAVVINVPQSVFVI